MLVLTAPCQALNNLDNYILPIPDVVSKYPEQVELGQMLFHDARLSKNNQISCASCHSLIHGGTDGLKKSIGVDGQRGDINSPGIYNVSLNFRQFWDGRATDLIDQVDGPITNPKEMAMTWPQILAKLKQDEEFVRRFNVAFEDGLTINNIKIAIVQFEKSLLTPNSRFDQYLQGDSNAISSQEQQGFRLFREYGCVTCHQGRAVGGNLYQKMGVMGDYFVDRGDVKKADYGHFNITNEERDRYVFKVPGLRNVALTAPYFHDGSADDLHSAVTVMMKYQLGIAPGDKDVELIVLFLNTLTGEYRGQPLLAK